MSQGKLLSLISSPFTCLCRNQAKGKRLTLLSKCLLIFANYHLSLDHALKRTWIKRTVFDEIRRKFEMIAFNDVSNILSTVGLYSSTSKTIPKFDSYEFTIHALNIKISRGSRVRFLVQPLFLCFYTCTFLLSYYRWCHDLPCSGFIYIHIYI